MDENKLNVPETWDKNFQAKLRSEILRYLDRFFYDGPFEEKSIMASLMWECGGKLNPHQVREVIQEFLEDKK